MKSVMPVMVSLLLSGGPSPADAQVYSGPDAAACASATGGGAALAVEVDGFRDRRGLLRIQLYGDRPDEFLKKGAKLKRIDIAVSASGPMRVCVALPAPGSYAVAVLHDRNANHKLDITQDGAGFSGNPRLGLSKPEYSAVMFRAGPGLTKINVVLKYMQGAAARPIRR